MNVIGGGFIIVINYASGGGVSNINALLTEASDDILTEASDYLEYETV